MKKYIGIILVLVFVLTGCGSKSSDENFNRDNISGENKFTPEEIIVPVENKVVEVTVEEDNNIVEEASLDEKEEEITGDINGEVNEDNNRVEEEALLDEKEEEITGDINGKVDEDNNKVEEESIEEKEEVEITGDINGEVNEDNNIVEKEALLDEKEEEGITGYINGEVKSILGNEVVINGVNINLSEMGNKNFNRDNNSGERKSGGSKFTLEEFTVTIPVGIKVVEVTIDEDNNSVEQEASLADIKKGKNIKIEYVEDIDHMVKVSIIDSSGGARGMFPGAGGNAMSPNRRG